MSGRTKDLIRREQLYDRAVDELPKEVQDRYRFATAHGYALALRQNVSIGDWIEITRAAVRSAKKGDAKARDWLTFHLVGLMPATQLIPRVGETGNPEPDRNKMIEAMIISIRNQNGGETDRPENDGGNSLPDRDEPAADLENAGGDRQPDPVLRPAPGTGGDDAPGHAQGNPVG